MHLKCGEDGGLVSIELSPEELYELMAFETNCAQLVPEKDGDLLGATMTQYGFSREEMARYLDKPYLDREDIWSLQLLKRRSQNNEQAIEIIRQLQALESKLGATLLRTLVERSRLDR